MSEKKMGLFARLKAGLSKTRGNLTEKVDTLVRETRKIDDDFYDELEESLILADLGVDTSVKATDALRKRVREQHLKTTEEA